MEFRPATLADLAALRPLIPSKYWRALMSQVAGALAWTLWKGDARAALCGVDVLPTGILECWLVLPARPRATTAVIRQVLMTVATYFPDRVLIVRISDSNPAGRRMAILAGFLPLDEVIENTDFRTWARPALDPETYHPR